MLFKKREDETDKEFYERILLNKKLIGTWNDVAALIQTTTGKHETAESARIYYHRHLRNRKDEDPLRCLRMEKQAFRDERNGWEKQNRDAIRLTNDLEYLTESVEQIAKIHFKKETVPKKRGGKKSLIIILSDWHIGAEFKSIFGSYNTEIAEERLTEYLNKIKEIQEIYKIDKAYVFCVGDMINGVIHKTVQVKNRENLIEQITKASELIASFISELCSTFRAVEMTGVSGNHSRIDKKEDALKDERLDDLILYITQLLLKEKKNFHFQKPLDTTICKLTIANKNWYGVHGDYDRNNRTGILKLSAALEETPFGIVMGHLHSPSFNDYGNIHVVQGGSLSGAGDDYTVQKRLTGRASQTAVLIGADGKIEAIYPIEL